MVQINFAQREINCKIVYYGPGLSGKTTTLEVIHKKAPPEYIGEMVSIATESDRTLYFDFLPLNLGTVAGMTTKFQIYTVPGQVYYNATRKLVLKGVDGVIFVADSQRGKMEENKESLANLAENLKEHGIDIDSIPLVMQYNKRDLDDVYTVEELEKELNPRGVPAFESVASKGQGVFPALKALSKLVINKLNKEHAAVRRGRAAPRPKAKPGVPPKQPAGMPPRPAGSPVPPKQPPGMPPRPAGAPVPPKQPAGVPPRPAGAPVPPKQPAGVPPRPAGVPVPPKQPPGMPPRPAGVPVPPKQPEMSEVARGIPAPPQGTKPTGEIPVAGPRPGAVPVQPPPPSPEPEPQPRTVAVPEDEKVIIQGQGGGKLWLVILIVTILLVAASPFVLYKVAPGVLPSGVKKVLDGIMGGKGEEGKEAGSSPSRPAGGGKNGGHEK